ncbi:alpha/beta-hydrolase [Auricularia subglabra TFB-10046 SS5]|nr:alpha/beta-hydrolase [Auricularia subglabra TFB-10046 SS5]
MLSMFTWLVCATVVASRPFTMHTREYFYIGGRYVDQADGAFADGQMYVEHLRPARVMHALPLVLIHGLGQTGTNWLNTPDGRPGWADFFLAKGYEVQNPANPGFTGRADLWRQLYIIDQPERGRSPWNPAFDGGLQVSSALVVAQRFTAPELFDIWPQARFHTQWIGNGTQGEPVFDAFYASQVQSLDFDASAESQAKSRHAGGLLLDKVGGGPVGWVIADARPSLVHAIVAIEPSGPPFINTTIPPVGPARPFGLTDIPLAFDPPITSAADLQKKLVSNDSVTTCFEQAAPARQLANLRHIPVLMVTSEASFRAPVDPCTTRFLRQAGVDVKHLLLQDVGIRGNGHMMFMERNSDEIAAVLEEWIAGQEKR